MRKSLHILNLFTGGVHLFTSFWILFAFAFDQESHAIETMLLFIPFVLWGIGYGVQVKQNSNQRSLVVFCISLAFITLINTLNPVDYSEILFALPELARDMAGNLVSQITTGK